MKKFYLAIILILLFGCSKKNSTPVTLNETTEKGNLSIKLIWDTPTGKKYSVPAGVETINIYIHSQDMAEIKSTFTASANSGAIPQVSIGTNRSVLVNGLDSTGKVIYVGETNNVTVSSAKTTDISVTLNPYTYPNGKFYFVEYNYKYVSGNSIIDKSTLYSINLDGTSKTSLTTHSDYSSIVDISPDGNKILLKMKNNNTYNVYIINSDGSNLINLTNSPVDVNYASFSPDGNKIIYRKQYNGNFYDIYVMNLDGSNNIKLTNTGLVVGHPKFNLDGTKIFYNIYDVNTSVGKFMSINIDGTNETEIMNNFNIGILSNDFIFSSDGTKIVYGGINVNNKHDFYIMNIDGSGKQQITNNNFDWEEGLSQYLSNNDTVFFYAPGGGGVNIFSVNVIGTNLINLTNSLSSNYDYSKYVVPKDFGKIVYKSSYYYTISQYSIEYWMMDYDGKNKVLITSAN